MSRSFLLLNGNIRKRGKEDSLSEMWLKHGEGIRKIYWVIRLVRFSFFFLIFVTPAIFKGGINIQFHSQEIWICISLRVEKRPKLTPIVEHTYAVCWKILVQSSLEISSLRVFHVLSIYLSWHPKDDKLTSACKY